MTAKSLLIVCVLGVSSITVASAKSYYFTLAAPAKAGATELKAGDYEVNVKGTQAVITNDGGKSFTIPVTIEQSDKKFGSTSVDTSGDVINETDLGGSQTKLRFAK